MLSYREREYGQNTASFQSRPCFIGRNLTTCVGRLLGSQERQFKAESSCAYFKWGNLSSALLPHPVVSLSALSFTRDCQVSSLTITWMVSQNLRCFPSPSGGGATSVLPAIQPPNSASSWTLTLSSSPQHVMNNPRLTLLLVSLQSQV